MKSVIQKISLIALGAAFLASSAKASFPVQTGLTLPSKEELMGEDSCAILAAYATAPKAPEDMVQKARECALAERYTCRDTRDFVKGREKQDPFFQKALALLTCK